MSAGESTHPDDVLVKCSFCEKIIAEIREDRMNPEPEECYRQGNVPIPNFGWFCSQACALDYERQRGRTCFARGADGRIDYYAGD